MKLPHHWQTLRVRDLGRVVTGRTPPSDIAHCFGGEVPFITPGDLGRGKIVQSTERTLTENGVSKVNVVRRGSVFFTCIGLIGKTGQALSRSAFNQQINAIEPSEDFDDSFVFYLITKLGPYIARLAGAVTLPIVNKSEFCDFPISVPPLPEQRKIAAILSTWDEALEKLDSLIAAKDRRKQALMQQLLTGQKRAKRFAGKWRTQELGSVVKPISRPVPKPAEPFLAAGIRSHGKGVFLKQNFKPSEIALDELFQLRTDDLVVNITFAWEGALAIVPPEANGALVSHRFPAFLCEDGKAALGFIRHLIRTKHFVFLCGLSSPGGAGRNRVLSKTSFLKIAVSMPSFPEQTEIAAILDTCDKELRLLRAQRVALDQQKRGLMQRLLTGRVRVHPEKESRHA